MILVVEHKINNIFIKVIMKNLLSWLCPLIILSSSKTYIANGQDECSITDPYAEDSTPLRESIRGKHTNVDISIMLLDFQSCFMQEKIRNFENLTGASVNQVFSTQATWYQDVYEDIVNYDHGFIDLYASFGNWVPYFAELGGFKDISDEIINQAVGEDWLDIMPAVRTGVATYNGKIYAVPLDGDVIYMIYRTDLVEGRGLPTPRSWKDVVDILDYYGKEENADFTNDTIADYGNCFATAENDISNKMFWAIASSVLQTQGTSQGAFFDAETMDPISSSDNFQDVLLMVNKLVQNSPFRDDQSGVDWQKTRSLFNEGRCVLFYNYPGPIKSIISDQVKNGMSGKINLAPLPGKKCIDGEYCPFQSEYGVNHAPFLASGGMAYAVNSRISEQKQAAALDFALYLSDPGGSFWDVAHPESFLDPLRLRHTASLSNNRTKESRAFLDFGWESRQLSE